METEYILVLITAPNAEEGKRIATVLVEDGLAACVNILPLIDSIYRWQGDILTDQESLLLCKTRRELFEGKFVPAVKELHPYEVPEIIALPIAAGSKSYLDWIRSETDSI